MNKAQVLRTSPGTLEPVAITLMLSGLSWAVLMMMSASGISLVLCLSPGAGTFRSFQAALEAQLLWISPIWLVQEWTLMVLAMMVPLFAPALKGLSASSYRNKRYDNVTCATLGFVVAAFLAGVIAIPLIFLLRTAIELGPGILGPILLFGLASVWQGTHIRTRIVARCHQPLYPSTAKSVVCYGLRQGVYCSLSCLPAMVATMATGQGLLPMFLVTHLMLSERMVHRPSQSRFQSALILIGVCCSITAAITLG